MDGEEFSARILESGGGQRLVHNQGSVWHASSGVRRSWTGPDRTYTWTQNSVPTDSAPLLRKCC